ncbi:hypothetical protein [Streptomyces lutosisoli]|uniref:Uncharacterized protein n=1 Tax=Streptomyces lutosisoli TaxID=2665721 RepID=A0ABW2VLJ1_9ACTN
MVPAAEQDGAVAEARAYVAGQRVRHRVLLGWSLSLAVPAREIAELLRMVSRGFRKGDPEVPRYEGQSQADYMVDSMILLVITRVIGVVLWLASVCVLVLLPSTR